MKLLAISDTYIPVNYMTEGLAPLQELGIDVEVRHWDHESLVGLQEDNLRVEQGGPEAVKLAPELTAGLDEFDILITQFCPISRSFLEAASRLKLIGVLRGGLENIDLEYATECGICVMNTPGRLARAVAECTVGLILSEMRNLARSHERLRNGVWSRVFPNSDCIPELEDRTVGLVGYGAIAQLVARFLAGFGSRLIAYDPFFQGDPAPATMTDLDTVMLESDIVSVHARLTEETQHMIGRRELDLMKPTAILVNTARSGLIDEQALIAKLEKREIMGAALDVFDNEPLTDDSPFLKLDNVTITPHLAGSTADAFSSSPKKMARYIAALLNGELAGLPVMNGVDAPEFS